VGGCVRHGRHGECSEGHLRRVPPPKGRVRCLPLPHPGNDGDPEQAGRRFIQVLKDTAARDVGLLRAEDTDGLITGSVDLDAKTALSRGYQAGNILAIYYSAAELPDEGELHTDLTRLLLLYQALVEARENIGAEEAPPEPGTRFTGLEATRDRWHRRVERSPALARKAKQLHGHVCQTCGINMGDAYGPVGEGYIEAHHLTPLARLNGRPTELDPATDFAVVCPNCHRMLHKGPPFTLEELRAMLAEAVSLA
jgi:5-methylcytosine-specific restriction protein A